SFRWEEGPQILRGDLRKGGDDLRRRERLLYHLNNALCSADPDARAAFEDHLAGGLPKEPFDDRVDFRHAARCSMPPAQAFWACEDRLEMRAYQLTAVECTQR